MVQFKDFSTFSNLIAELKESGKYIKLFGSSKEIFTGALTPTSKHNQLKVKLCAITNIGTFYFNETINLKNDERISEIKSFFDSHEIISSNISISTGTLEIS